MDAKNVHRRSNDDDDVYFHEREEDHIPQWLKWTFISINRVGFPVVAFLLVWHLCEVSNSKVVEAVNNNTVVLMEIKTSLNNK